MMELDEKNRILRIPKFVYPGDKVSPSVSFYAPDKPGTYVMNWKMKDSKGKIVFPGKQISESEEFCFFQDRKSVV